MTPPSWRQAPIAAPLPETPSPIRLGLGANWRQFTLLVVVNAFVGAMVGLERTVLPLIAQADLGGFRNEAEVSLGDQREDGAFEPHHGADEGIDDDEQRELTPVGAEAEPDGRRRLRQRRSDWRRPPARWGHQATCRLRSGRRCGDGSAVLAGAGRGSGSRTFPRSHATATSAPGLPRALR